MTVFEKRRQATRRETPVAKNVPYMGHLTPSIIDTEYGDCLCVLRLSGAAFECADDEVINTRKGRLNKIILGLADPRISVWQHLVRRDADEYPDCEFPPGYACELNNRYKEKISAERLMVNELYLTVVLQPFRTKAEGALASLFSTRSPALIRQARQDQVAELDQIITDLIASLSYYDAERLEAYSRDGVLYSQPGEFFNFLLTGRWERVPLAAVPLKYLIAGVRPLFGHEVIELRNADHSHYGAVLGIHTYPEETHPLFLNDLLNLPFELVVSQSFAFRGKDSTKASMSRRERQMETAGDRSNSQAKDIDDAADDLDSRRVVFGAHHYNVMVRANTIEELPRNVADARAALVEGGLKPAREDLAMEAAYWAQLPGNFKFRPRLSPINSVNLCGFAPLHNFPSGRRSGNHWGDALTMLVTAAGTPHYLNLHAMDPQSVNGGGKKEVGHTGLYGPTGSGKTATKAFILSMFQKLGVTSVLFSYQRDAEIIVRLLRGKVYRLRLNEPTGLAPFACNTDHGSEGARNVQHIHKLVRKLMSRPVVTETGMEVDSKPLNVVEEKDVQKAVTAVLSMPQAVRRLGRVLDFLPKGDLYERLARWCYAREEGREDGPLAWAFDNVQATIANELGNVRTTMFDTTAFLDDPELRGSLMLHLFHLTKGLADGRRLAVSFSEYWKSLGDKEFADFFNDLVRTLRHRNGLVIPDTQMISDALTHPMARALIEQMATLILFPNPGADKAEYMQGLGLSEREFNLLKTDLPEGCGMFLLKQGRHSVVLQLPLAGMDDDLAVLSPSATNLALMDRLIAQYGEDPDAWIPHFHRERKSA